MPNFKPDIQDVDLKIFQSLKVDTEDQIFLRMRKTEAAKRQLIFDNIPNIELLLSGEMNQFLRRVLGHLPKNLIDRWLIVRIMADAVDVYQNETAKILEQISTVTGKSLKIAKALDWNQFAQEAKTLIQAQENLYEIKAYPDVEATLLYLEHFYKNFQTKQQIDNLVTKIQLALKEFTDADYTLAMSEQFDYEKFLAKEVIPEYEPNQRIVNTAVIGAAIDSWQLIPKIEKDRLLNPANKVFLIEALVNANRALKTLKLTYLNVNKPTLNDLIFWLRERAKRRLKLMDYVDSQEIVR